MNTNTVGSANPIAYIQVTKPIKILSSEELRHADECMGKYNLQISFCTLRKECVQTKPRSYDYGCIHKRHESA